MIDKMFDKRCTRRQHVIGEVASAENYENISIVNLQNRAPRIITLNNCPEQPSIINVNAQKENFCDNQNLYKGRSIVESSIYGRIVLQNTIIRRTSV